MSYECQIEERTTQPIVSIRTRTSVDKLPEVMGTSYGRIMAYLGSQGVYPSDAPFVAYYNMDMQDMDVEIGFPIPTPLPVREKYRRVAIPSARWRQRYIPARTRSSARRTKPCRNSWTRKASNQQAWPMSSISTTRRKYRQSSCRRVSCSR